MNINALTAYLALSSGSYSGILRDMYAVHNLGLNPDLHTKLLANRFVGVTKELSGIPPLSFTSKGKPLTAWSITGATVQDGTPTPENPVEVQVVGDYDSETGMYKIPVVTRGKNLFDKTAVRYEVAIGNVLVDYPGSAIFIIPAIKGIKNYTLKVKSDVDINVIRLAFYDKPIPVPGEKVNNTKETLNSKNPIVTSSNVNNLPYIVAQISGAFVDSYGLDTVQLEIGDTATPYEAYHEPVTTPIYLPTPLYSGEVLRSDGSREVKWGVVDLGSLNWSYKTKFTSSIISNAKIFPNTLNAGAFCSLYQCVSANTLANGKFALGLNNEARIYLQDDNYTSSENFKQAMQGVMLYYKLATPATETFTAPQIPTLNGTTVIDVDTAVKPTEMYTKYKSSK